MASCHHQPALLPELNGRRKPPELLLDFSAPHFSMDHSLGQSRASSCGPKRHTQIVIWLKRYMHRGLCASEPPKPTLVWTARIMVGSLSLGNAGSKKNHTGLRAGPNPPFMHRFRYTHTSVQPPVEWQFHVVFKSFSVLPTRAALAPRRPRTARSSWAGWASAAPAASGPRRGTSELSEEVILNS